MGIIFIILVVALVIIWMGWEIRHAITKDDDM